MLVKAETQLLGQWLHPVAGKVEAADIAEELAVVAPAELMGEAAMEAAGEPEARRQAVPGGTAVAVALVAEAQAEQMAAAQRVAEAGTAAC